MDERIILRTMNESEMSRGLLINPLLSRHLGDIIFVLRGVEQMGVDCRSVGWFSCELPEKFRGGVTTRMMKFLAPPNMR